MQTPLMTARTPVMLIALVAVGCYTGTLTDSIDSVDQRNISGIAQPGSLERLPVDFTPRTIYGTENTLESLSFAQPELQDYFAAQDLFDATDPTSGLGLFVLPQDRDPMIGPGLGPIMNQLSCVGCHRNTELHAELLEPQDLQALVATTDFLDSTPAGRAHRIEPPEATVGQLVTLDDEIARNVETAAFTLFGDFNTFDGTFIGLQEFGGPVFHVRALGECEPDFILPASQDPNLLSDNVVRVQGERAGPPYIGRGLMEAVYWEDIVADEDPNDLVNDFESEDPTVALLPLDHPCGSDCISGRQNQNRAANAIVGGDPIIRTARFGLRAQGPTLIQFMVGGSQGELGFTSPLAPNEPSNPLNANNDECVDDGPDPELSVGNLNDLRDMIRLVAPPRPGRELLDDPDADPNRQANVEAGAALFGLDLQSFRDRMRGDVTSDEGVDLDVARARATDRQLNCVGCHTPIMGTGISPAADAVYQEALSNRWAPLFSNMLIHDMGGFPPGFDPDDYIAVDERFDGVSRNLADFALPGQGLARGTEWRTPPLMGLGKIGPPLMHDGRVYVNPDDPISYYAHNADIDAAGTPVADRLTPIDNVNEAFIAAIELHDLPTPADTDGDGLPNYEDCPAPVAEGDFCGRDSDFRSEARFVMEKWRALTRAEQLQVVTFLRQL